MSDDSEPEEDDNVVVECRNCGYTWEYTSNMWKATCPNCGRKTPTPYDPDYSEGDEEDDE